MNKKISEVRTIDLPDIYLSAYLKYRNFKYKPILHGERVIFEFEFSQELMNAIEDFTKTEFFKYTMIIKQLRGWIHALK